MYRDLVFVITRLFYMVPPSCHFLSEMNSIEQEKEMVELEDSF